MSAAPSPSSLPFRHLLVALAVVTVWGSNFTIIRIGLDHLPPLLFATLRFALACVPAFFLVRRPRHIGWGTLAAYGLLIGAGQFGLLFIAMNGHISPGLASLVLQMQVFFTIGLAVLITGERVQLAQGLALALAAAGILVIALHTDASTTPLGLALAILAATSWAGGNIVAKRSRVTDLLPFVVWSSFFAMPPLLILSLLFDGPARIAQSLATADFATWMTVVWQTVGNTLFGYSAWGWLLSRHPAATITPVALLIPIVGMATSTLWLGEPLQSWKILAAALVIGGLALGLFGARLGLGRRRLR